MVEIKLKTKNSSCEFNIDFNEIKIPDNINLLKDLEKEIENSIYHLKRSNDEIKSFDPLCQDNELFLAINENKIALSRKEERLKFVKNKIKNIENLNEITMCNNPLTGQDQSLQNRSAAGRDDSCSEKNDNLSESVSNGSDSNSINENKIDSQKNSNILKENGIYL